MATRKRIVLTNNATPSNGQIPIGNATDYTVAALTGTTNQLTVTNGAGTITLSTPQNTHTAATPTFAGMTLNGKLTTYNSIATITNGVPSLLAQVNLTAQGAAIAATTVYAVPASGVGLYRVSMVASITRAASTSSVLGGTNAFQIIYTDADDSVVKTTITANSITSAANTTATAISDVLIANCKASTNLQYSFDYTSVGVTSMQYNIHIRVEAL